MDELLSIEALKDLLENVEGFSKRSDLSIEVYETLLEAQESYSEFLETNPNCYGEKATWDKASTINRYIRFLLMLKITEFMELNQERKYKSG